MKRLMLISLLSCMVVGSVRSQDNGTLAFYGMHVEIMPQNTDFNSGQFNTPDARVNQQSSRLMSVVKGVGATLAGGILGCGIGECFNAPRAGFQLGVALPAIGATYAAYQCAKKSIASTTNYGMYPTEVESRIGNSQALMFGAAGTGLLAVLASFCFGRS